MKDIAILGLKLLAIYVIIQMLELAQFIVPYFMYEQTDSIEAISLAVIILIHWFLAGLLFFGAERFSKYLIPKQPGNGLKIKDYEKFVAALFSTAGLLVVFWGINMLFNAVSYIANIEVVQPDFLRNNKQYYFWIPFMKGGVQIVLGLLLFIGGKKLAKWWADFRNWT